MKITLLLIFITSNAISLFGQTDSLVFINGNYIVGELKTMDKGVLTIETDYSDKDFKIELTGVKKIYTSSIVSITLTDGTRLTGTLKTTNDNKVEINTIVERIIIGNLNEIVEMKTIDEKFWDRLYASIDLSLDVTKSNNFRQFNSRSTLGYLTEKWSLDASYNTLLSNQDGADSIRRTESMLRYKALLPNGWYIPASIDFLSNTEQKLELRTGVKLGAGKFIIQTNRVYWGLASGLNYNNENFSTDNSDKQSIEGYLGTDLNIFDIGDLNLLTNIYVYPSFTEGKRLRSDFKFDLKYDLPLDFYISIGVTINYDNQPVEGATSLDYVAHTGFGWEW